MKTQLREQPKPRPRKPSLRRCVGCLEMKDKRQMLRVVRTEEGIEPDKTGKKNGRGAYICSDLACLEKACKNKGLERSFKQAVTPEVYELIKNAMAL